MKGLAPAHTLTGQVQRQLDDWTSASTVMARLGLLPKQYRTVEALLERLVKEGRAEKHDGRYRSVLPQADATFAKGDGETGGPSASASERTLRGAQVRRREPSPAPLGTSSDPDGAPGDILSSPSPREGSVPQAGPSQLVLPLPARLREGAA